MNESDTEKVRIFGGSQEHNVTPLAASVGINILAFNHLSFVYYYGKEKDVHFGDSLIKYYSSLKNWVFGDNSPFSKEDRSAIFDLID